MSLIHAQSTNVRSSIDKVCITGSSRSDVNGAYMYSYWHQNIGAPVYYNIENKQYLHPYVVSNTVYRYVIEAVPGSSSGWSYCELNINNSSNASYEFNPDDFFKGWYSYVNNEWIRDANQRLVNCNNVCITGNDNSHLDGTYVWSNFSLSVSSSIYYCKSCDTGSNAYDGAYLYGWNHTYNWLIGPFPVSYTTWSACKYSTSTIITDPLNLNDCNQWDTFNGSVLTTDTNMAVNKYKCPTISPTVLPSISPSTTPTKSPSNQPTNLPSASTSKSPSKSLSDNPTRVPSNGPTGTPSVYINPTKMPTNNPTIIPSKYPTNSPSNPIPNSQKKQSVDTQGDTSDAVEMTDTTFIIGICIVGGCCMIPVLIGIITWFYLYVRKNKTKTKQNLKTQIDHSQNKTPIDHSKKETNVERNIADNKSTISTISTVVTDITDCPPDKDEEKLGEDLPNMNTRLDRIESGLSDGIYGPGDQQIDDIQHTLRTSNGGEQPHMTNEPRSSIECVPYL